MSYEFLKKATDDAIRPNSGSGNINLPEKNINIEDIDDPQKGLIAQTEKAIKEHLKKPKQLDKVTLQLLEDIKAKAREYAKTFEKEDERRLFGEVAEAYTTKRDERGQLRIINEHRLFGVFEHGWRGGKGFEGYKLIEKNNNAVASGAPSTKKMRYYAGESEGRLSQGY